MYSPLFRGRVVLYSLYFLKNIYFIFYLIEFDALMYNNELGIALGIAIEAPNTVEILHIQTLRLCVLQKLNRS